MGLKSWAKKKVSKAGKAAKSAGKAAKNAAGKVGKAGEKAASTVGKAGKQAAGKIGGTGKKVGARVGKGAASVGEGALSVVQEAGNRLVGLPEAGLNALGVLPMKKLRLRVIVLAKSDGQPVVGTAVRSAEELVKDAVAVANDLFRREAKFKIVSAGAKMVTVDTKPAPAAALEVRCDTGALKDDLGEAGFYFRKRMARNAVGAVLGAGAPVTAFIVADVLNKAGCSLGPLTDYVTVDAGGIGDGSSRTLAHELGHALGLPHTGGAGSALSGNSGSNLMTSSGHGTNLNKRQVITVRNSRHVTFV